MSQSADTPTSHSRAAEIATPSPAEVRTSKQRAEEIKQYILGLLPAHISKSVDVVITEQVPTAAVLPATEDALLTDGQAEFDRQQARRLIESVDGDYLVLITARETPDAGPLDDELSADRAHQFGLAFHETLHILKTAFKGIQTLLADDVEDQYRDFVHDLINATEDGAIEHEVYVGEDFSTRAGNRLRLVREIHKRKPEDYEALPEGRSEFTFRDALQKALHDNVILPPSGTTSALLDEDDDRVTFASDEERTVFLQIYPEIERLADDIHSTRGDVGTELHRNDAEASIRRAKRTIKFWHEVVKPLVDTDASEQGQDQQQQQSGGDGQPNQSGEQGQGQNQQQQQGQAGESPSSTQGSSAGSDGDSQQDATQTGSQSPDSPQDSSGEAAPGDDISPEDLSLERNAVSDSLQGVADHPSITDEPNPDDVDLNPDGAEDESGSDDSTNSSSIRENGDEPSKQGGDPDPSTDTDSDSTSGEMPDAPGQPDSDGGDDSERGESSTDDQGSATDATPEDDAGESESHSGGEVEVESESDSSDLASSTQSSSGASTQSTFGDFAQDGSESESANGGDDGSEAGGESGAGESQTAGVGGNKDASGEQESESGQSENTSGESTSSENAESADQNGTSPEEGSSPSQSSESGESGQPAEDGAPTTSGGSQSQDSENGQPDASQQSRGSSSTGEEQSTSSASTSGVSGPEQTEDELSSEDFESDRKRAQQTADEISSDGDALQRELEALDQMLGDEAEADPGSEAGGSGAGAGSINELSVLPDPQDESASEMDWGTVEKAAGTVADTLAKQLQLDQQTGVRSGLTSGTTVNRKAAYRLGYGDPRVFDTQIPGDEKEYFIVIVLDRSGSMDPARYNSNGSNGPTKIQVATSAVARFAVACEDLGIDVAVVDFYDDTARLAKPASVDAEFAQEALLNTDAGGGTPLSDALTLATSLSEMDSKESIIITMTDGKPRDVDATAEVIKQSYAPVCSLTVATDCEPGNPPERAAELEPHFDQTTTVFDPEKLDDRLDQFAALLGMY
jgi:hypothetical protein